MNINSFCSKEIIKVYGNGHYIAFLTKSENEYFLIWALTRKVDINVDYELYSTDNNFVKEGQANFTLEANKKNELFQIIKLDEPEHFNAIIKALDKILR